MLDLPATTYFGKRIPKQKFYDHLSVTPEIRRCFTEQISAIVWKNKIAPQTANVSAGENVNELEVFEIRLNQPELNRAVLQLIDREIPYHILFILTCEGKERAVIGYKETAQSGNSAFKVTAYYETPWLDSVSLRMEGRSMDAVYENFVRQAAGFSKSEEPLRETIARAEQCKKLQRQIDALQKKVDNEKQFNRRVELNGQLKALRKQMEGYR